ncbi:MAG: C40 family peptidase [Bacteroidia bacterium]|jgi:cell wall-associated NlpC family hydrolase|nr:C40 family peptidase [Bacteroidia bacterium]
MVLTWIRILIVIAFAACIHTAVAQQVDTLENDTGAIPKDTLVSQKVVPQKALTRADSLVNYAYTFMGDRYRRGGTGAKGFDCSGYTLTVYKAFGISLPHTSAGQGLVGISVPKSQISKGDLILFKGRSRKSSRIGHVGIVVSEKGEPVRFIHSSTSEGVRIDRLDFVYYKKRYVKTVRIPQLHS